MISHVEARYAEELEALYESGNNGLTIQEMVDLVGMSYHTIRNDFRKLQVLGKITHTGRTRDKNFVYVAQGKYNVPTVLMPQKTVPFTFVVDQAIKNVWANSLNYNKVLALVLTGISARTAVGPNETLDFYPKVLKEALVASINRAQGFVDAAQSVLDDPRYWDENRLPDTLNVDKYDAIELITITRNLMKEVFVNGDSES